MSNFIFHKDVIFRTPTHHFATIVENEQLLKEEISKPEFLEALYIASPTLYEQVHCWLSGRSILRKDLNNLKYSLYKYFSRNLTRCTPYGLFAQCAIAHWGDKNVIRIQSRSSRKTRLDMHLMSALKKVLASRDYIQPFLKYFPNTSLYKLGKQYRYVEYHYNIDKRKYRMSSVDATPYLEVVLKIAKSGSTLREIKPALMPFGSEQEIDNFLQEAVLGQVIVSEFEMSVTGDDPLEQLINRLKEIQRETVNQQLSKTIDAIGKLSSELNNLNQRTGNSISEYKALINEINNLGVSINENRAFQVDSIASRSEGENPMSINAAIQNKLLSVLNFLVKLNPSQRNSHLDTFKTNFQERYEAREIPLMTALDTESGIGYPKTDALGVNFLVDDIIIPDRIQTTSASLTFSEQLLLRVLAEAIRNNSYEVHLDKIANDIPELSEFAVPPTLSCMFKVINDKTDQIVFINAGGGSSAANILGRFAYAEENIHAIVKEIAAFEQDVMPNKTICEIAHLPEDRVGNILFRPAFRKYEIPFLAKSGLSIERQVLLDDLVISVSNNKIILKSNRLNKEIIPRLTTAHNFSVRSLPVYHFLCDLQLQDTTQHYFAFTWGPHSTAFPMLPRAVYNGVIIFPATWNLVYDDYKELMNASDSDEICSQIKAWQTKWKMPSWIVLKDGDNELFIDLDIKTSIVAFLNEIKKRTAIILSEFLFDPNKSIIRDQYDRPYTNEMIAILYNQQYKITPVLKNTTNHFNDIQRHFFPGEEWIYFKIYCGVKTSDNLITVVLFQLLQKLQTFKLIEKWFFVRYSDPHTHIRLRFLQGDLSKHANIFKLFNQCISVYANEGLIHKIQIDTYSREVERYGSTSIELSEDIFSIDSWAVVNVLSMASGYEDEEFKWQFAMKSVDDLLNQFLIDDERKMNLIELLRTNFIAEHSTDKSLKFQLDVKYRKMRQVVEEILNDGVAPQIAAILKWRKDMLQPIASQIIDLNNSNKLGVSLESLISSYIHMSVNRIFKSKQRTHEMVIYDFLYRYHRSSSAKRKTKNQMGIQEKGI